MIWKSYYMRAFREFLQYKQVATEVVEIEDGEKGIVENISID